MKIGNLDISDREVKIGGACMGLVGCAIWAAVIIAGEDMQLYLEDHDYEDKCYSLDPKSSLKADAAKEQALDILAMISNFPTTGEDFTQSLEELGYTFCFDMDSDKLKPVFFWPRLQVMFSESTYPPELAASYFAEPARDAYWNAQLRDAQALNQYTPESGLLFSRASRAAKVAIEMGDILVATGQRYLSADMEPWKTYIEENPTLANTVTTFVQAYKGTVSYDDAMRLAMDIYMNDPKAMNEGDVEFLNTYLEHVSILSKSSYEAIYEGPGLNEYAKVDADRDGFEDDLIEFGYNNRAKIYHYDYDSADFWLSRKQESRQEDYDCGTDEAPATCTRTVWDDVSERVYYDVIPARNTATIDMSPQTITAINDLTLMRIWNTVAAQSLINDPEAPLLHSPEAQALMMNIRVQMHQNLPNRPHAPSTPGYGLKVPGR